MAFDLKDNNQAGNSAVGLSPSGERATPFNFISPYDYATQYKPELTPQLYMKYGKGTITGFVRLTGSEMPFASDEVKHAEQGRLMTSYDDVTIVGDVFTFTDAHTLRVNDEVIISDGSIDGCSNSSAILK